MMTLGTTPLQYKRHVLGEGDLALVFETLAASYQAAFGFDFRDRDRLAREHFGQGVPEICLPWFLAFVRVTKAIVDASPITDVAASIEYERFWRAACAEQVGCDLIPVNKNRKADFEFFHMLRDRVG